MLTDAPKISNREQQILGFIIQNYIMSVTPVASKILAENYELNVSPATIRNDMKSLEEKGYLNHLHTSSGKVPTDLGYRFYVNSLMATPRLSESEAKALDMVKESLEQGAVNEAFHAGARLLARLSNLLAVTIAPRLADGTLQKIELVSLSSERLLIVLTIENEITSTVTIEVKDELKNSYLRHVSGLLNERLSGYKLREIRAEISEMLADVPDDENLGLIRVFVDRADTIFETKSIRKFHFGGIEYIALQPEFSDLSNYKSIIEVVEKEDLIVHLFDDINEFDTTDSDKNVHFRIGSENKLQQMEQCSIVSANYKLGGVHGKIGLVGPTRMDYARMAMLVEQLAGRLNRPFA